MLRYSRAIPLQLTLFLLAACAGAGADAPEGVSADPPQERVAAAAPTEPPTESLLPTTPPTSIPTLEAVPTPRQDLQATDPGTVQLASGEPMLVKFFAFW